MKKIFFSLLAIAAIASCAKTETVYTEVDSEIKLAPVAAMQTKANVLAAIHGTEYPTAENFDVYGYWKNVGAGETYTDGASYFGGTGVEFINKGNYWGGAKTYYWPKNGALRFAAYSPSSLDIAHSQDGDTFSGSYTQPSETAKTWDFLVAPTSPSYTAMTAAENVSIVFEHALSWITLKVKASDAEAENVFTIKSVTINGVNTTADFKASMLDQEMVQYEAWSNWNNKAEYVVFEGEQGVSGEAEVIETTSKGTLVIPQATTSVTVVFNQAGVNGTMDMEDMKVTLDLNLDVDDEPWRPGYHYTYTLIFGLDEILINPSVDEWEEYIWAEGGSQGNIETDKTVANVATEEQLIAALAAGGKVVLQNDITTTATLEVTNTVVLELNGFTLTNQKSNSSTDVIIVREGGELTINGEGTVEAVSGNDGYAVISEGLLIINGGTFKAGLDVNNDGNCIIYARKNGKVFINGGTFEGTAEDTTTYLINKKDADRLTTEISIAGGTYKNFNPGNTPAEGEGTSFLKAGYTSLADGDNYIVVKGEIDALVKTQAELDAAAAEGATLLLAAGEYTLANYPAGLTLIGAEDGVVFNAEGKAYGVKGNVTFENVKILFSNANYKGFQHTDVEVYKNCTIVGQPFLYGNDVTYQNCTFEQTSANAYNVWTYGAKNVKFTDCTFNCAGKSVLIYSESKTLVQNVTFENCVLNASAPVEGKAAIEIDSSLVSEFNVVINNTTANGFAKGSVSENTLWNNKKGEKANVTVDGTVVL